MWPLKIEPLPVQVEAFRRSHGRERFGLFCEMGLGKTFSALADYVGLLMRDEVASLVVLAPNYLKSGWRDQIEMASLPMPVFTWPKIEEATPGVLRNPHIVVLNYEAVLGSGGVWLFGRLRAHPYMLVLDESSAIKNFKGVTTRRVFELANYCKSRRALSGMPMSQSVMDLWSQLRFLGALSGVNPYAFRNQFAVMGGYMGKQVKGVKNGERLREIIDEVAFRALKVDWWSGAPEKVYLPPLEFELGARQKEAYRTMAHEFYVLLDQATEDAVFADAVIHALQKLQQITRGFIIDGQRTVPLVADIDNPALKVARSFVEAARGKVLVFAFHRYSVDLLERVLVDHYPAVLRGGMTESEIAGQKDLFATDRDCRVMVAQLTVGSRGHTLLGGQGDDRCSTTLFFENNYSLETRLQAEDRNHRIGQDRAVVYADLFGCREDRAVIDALHRKQEVVDAVVNTLRARPKEEVR